MLGFKRNIYILIVWLHICNNSVIILCKYTDNKNKHTAICKTCCWLGLPVFRSSCKSWQEVVVASVVHQMSVSQEHWSWKFCLTWKRKPFPLAGVMFPVVRFWNGYRGVAVKTMGSDLHNEHQQSAPKIKDDWFTPQIDSIRVVANGKKVGLTTMFSAKTLNKRN